jgi:DNA primase
VSAHQSNDFKETVRNQTDLVGLIGESIALSSRSGGREFVALCPFHDDHDPSLHVYPDRQSYRCWVCNQGGDCFTWVMEYDKVGFREALEILAKRANIPIPAIHKRGGPADDDRATLHDVLRWAQDLFHDALLKDRAGEEARTYVLQTRRLSLDTVKRFKLGFHPNDWEWLLQKARGKYPPKLLLGARLVGERSNGPGYYDNFVDRVLFPICNERGQPVGFGGRVLPGHDDSKGKYWNSPESPLFQKSKLAYGLNFARDAIVRSKTAIVVEGYTDCIALHQAGVTNAVGTLGTALTDMHVATIKRFARKVVLVYDGDGAGQSAADRAVERFLAQDVDLRILTLPGGLDPAEYLAEHSAETFQQLVDRAPEAWEYKLLAARKRHGIDTVDGRQRVLDEMLTVLSSVPNMAQHIRESLLLGNLATRLHFNEAQVRERYRELRGRSPRRVRVDGGNRNEPSQAAARVLAGQLTRDDRLECEVLEVLFVDPALVSFIAAEVPLDAIRNERLRALLRVCYELADGREVPAFERVMGALEDAELKRLAVWIDDQARAKNIAVQLRGTMAESVDGCPLFLRRSLENLNWRREEQSHGRRAVELSVQGDGAHRMDEATEALLRQGFEFHQRRATKRAPA